MAPVDLAHVERLGKALATASDLGRHYGIPVCYVAVTAPTPGPIAHNPTEFAQKLDAFAKKEAEERGHEAESKAYTSHDPSIDLDDTLMKAVDEIGADLVVMASHIPNVTDYVWPSNGGTLATHSDASVFVVR
jgi:nucleotide-binding universal stress UspA family protein